MAFHQTEVDEYIVECATLRRVEQLPCNEGHKSGHRPRQQDQSPPNLSPSNFLVEQRGQRQSKHQFTALDGTNHHNRIANRGLEVWFFGKVDVIRKADKLAFVAHHAICETNLNRKE